MRGSQGQAVEFLFVIESQRVHTKSVVTRVLEALWRGPMINSAKQSILLSKTWIACRYRSSQ